MPFRKGKRKRSLKRGKSFEKKSGKKTHYFPVQHFTKEKKSISKKSHKITADKTIWTLYLPLRISKKVLKNTNNKIITGQDYTKKWQTYLPIKPS